MPDQTILQSVACIGFYGGAIAADRARFIAVSHRAPKASATVSVAGVDGDRRYEKCGCNLLPCPSIAICSLPNRAVQSLTASVLRNLAQLLRTQLAHLPGGVKN